MISGCNRKTEDTVTFGNGFRHIEYLVDARPCVGLHGKCNAAKMIVLSFNAGNTKAIFQDFPRPAGFAPFSGGAYSYPRVP